MTSQYLNVPAFVEPRPFLMKNHNVVVSWSPKSACTHLAVWHFLKEGLLTACNHYHHWPHRYRTQVYYKGLHFQQRLAEVTQTQGQGWRLVKFTRNPTRRLVSQFRHAVQNNLIDDLVKTKVGIDPATDGLSLDDYHQALKGENLTSSGRLDIHVRQQHHPIWTWEFDQQFTINMDEVDLLAATQQLERTLGLGVVNFDAEPTFKYLRDLHYALDLIWDGCDASLLRHRFKRTPGQKAFPKTAFERLQATEAIAKSLYAVDFCGAATELSQVS